MKHDEYSLDTYEGIDRCMKEIDRIDDIIRVRERKPFGLPEDFSPELNEEEEKRILRICDALENGLASRGFVFNLEKDLPIKAYYLYVEHIAFITEGLRMPGGYVSTYTGCGGWCEGCFQKPWCRTRLERDDIIMENGY